jgi:hypothetical protein
MPAVALDADRLAQLRVFTDSEVRQIMSDVIDAVTAQLERLSAAVPSGDLKGAAEAAHRGRNEALLIGARELCDALTSLERAARAGDHAAMRGAADLAHELWPATEAAIKRVVAGDRASADGAH